MSEKLSEHIYRHEYECSCCKKLPRDFGKYPFNQPYLKLFDAFEKIRLAWGKPIKINRGYTCVEGQKKIIIKKIREEGFMSGEGYDCGDIAQMVLEKASLLSPHLFGVGLDLDTKNWEEAQELYRVINNVYPELRVGYKAYGGSHIHIDTVYLIFPRASEKWREGARW